MSVVGVKVDLGAGVELGVGEPDAGLGVGEPGLGVGEPGLGVADPAVEPEAGSPGTALNGRSALGVGLVPQPNRTRTTAGTSMNRQPKRFRAGPPSTGVRIRSVSHGRSRAINRSCRCGGRPRAGAIRPAPKRWNLQPNPRFPEGAGASIYQGEVYLNAYNQPAAILLCAYRLKLRASCDWGSKQRH